MLKKIKFIVNSDEIPDSNFITNYKNEIFFLSRDNGQISSFFLNEEILTIMKKEINNFIDKLLNEMIMIWRVFDCKIFDEKHLVPYLYHINKKTVNILDINQKYDKGLDRLNYDLEKKVKSLLMKHNEYFLITSKSIKIFNDISRNIIKKVFDQCKKVNTFDINHVKIYLFSIVNI